MAAMAVGGCDASDAVRSDLLDVYDARRRLGDDRDYLTALRPRCDGPQTKRHGRFLSSPFLFVVACVLSLSWKTVLLHKELSRPAETSFRFVFAFRILCLFDPSFLSSCVRVRTVTVHHHHHHQVCSRLRSATTRPTSSTSRRRATRTACSPSTQARSFRTSQRPSTVSRPSAVRANTRAWVFFPFFFSFFSFFFHIVPTHVLTLHF